MKLSNDNKQQYPHPNEIVPTVTLNEQLQRVAEWTRKPHPQTSSTYDSPAVDHQKEAKAHFDFEAQSELIVEGVRLMASRDQLIASGPPTAKKGDVEELLFNKVEKQKSVFDTGAQPMEQSWGSKTPAHSIVKEFEEKFTQKKLIESAIFNTYPYTKPKKGGNGNEALIHAASRAIPMIIAPKPDISIGKPSEPAGVPDKWKHYQSSRSIQFSMKYPDDNAKPGMKTGEADTDKLPDDKKRENDKDWWKWKLKQRFVENDLLLQKLADQRERLESTFVKLGTLKPKPTKEAGKTPSANPPFPSFNRDSSRHVQVEFKLPEPAHANGILSKPSGKSTKDPIPIFFEHSKAAVSTVKSEMVDQEEPSTLLTEDVTPKPPKLKTLKRDPYLAKLLSGNEMFKPEMMLEAAQSTVPKIELSHHHHQHNTAEYGNPRRKISLDSLTDSSDDELTAAKFFNPDVKVLYERFSELEVNNEKSKSTRGEGLFSREPSDGYLNLPILLATGRFNRYNKLPTIKGTANKSSAKGITTPVANRQSRKEKSAKFRVQTVSNKMKRDSVNVGKTGNMEQLDGLPKVFMGKSKVGQNIDKLSTKDWAKRLMQKMKQPDHGTSPYNKMIDDDALTDSDDDVANDDDRERRPRHHPVQAKLEDLDSIQAAKKYQVPTDQETNLLYHEILMSKWKKDKHENRGKDIETAGGAMDRKDGLDDQKRNESDPAGGGGQRPQASRHAKEDEKNRKGFPPGKPRGLDIWLENIREKAKRDRLIAPLPNEDTAAFHVEDDAGLSKNTQSFVMAFENAAFKM